MPTSFESYRSLTPTSLKRLRDGALLAVEPPIPPQPKPWYGFVDGRYTYNVFDQMLADSISGNRPVSTFMHGYSGGATPTSFASSSVSAAQGLGIGAMLNIKNGGDWQGAANGAYVGLWTQLLESWPLSVFGEITWEHEPENNGPSPAASSNPAWVTWANANAPAWKAGIKRFIDTAAPIIRRRGLKLKIGGCLMDFSWDTNRWTWFNWWDGLTPGNMAEVCWQVDLYAKTVNGSPPVGYDLLNRINVMLAEARSVGIESMSMWETAVDRRERHNGNVLVGTEASTTAWWIKYAAELEAIPEIRMVCYYHTPGGPASDQAFLTGTSISTYATICMNGRRGIGP